MVEQPARVGIRELKIHASAVIRRAARGETIIVTDRGRPVARIVPVRDDEGWWERLAQDGRLFPAQRDLLGVLREAPPGPLLPGESSPYEALMELRAGER